MTKEKENDLDRLAEDQRLRVDPSVPTTPLAPLLDLPLDELTRRLKDEKSAPRKRSN